ncbi:hypothetical protein J6590_047765 [Homalodisca vitripennis]|nr:hypothetical protein J6590_047765 [Homalodisca vitripennis]
MIDNKCELQEDIGQSHSPGSLGKCKQAILKEPSRPAVAPSGSTHAPRPVVIVAARMRGGAYECACVLGAAVAHSLSPAFHI